MRSPGEPSGPVQRGGSRPFLSALLASESNVADAMNVVLVHGGFVDGSGWRQVYDLLRGEQFNVRVVQNATISLDGDVATTVQVLDDLDGPAVLVGHSYGGAVVTEAGTHDKVVALAYIAA